MTDPAGRLITSRRIYAGRIFSVDVDRVAMSAGREMDLEIVRHPGSVVLLPMPSPDRIILVRQYRYAVDRWLWELPAGSLDPGEDAASAARRECHEEIGLVPRRVEHLGEYYPTPGFCAERMIFFRLVDLEEPSEAAKQDEDEQLEPRTFTIDEARQLIRRGKVADMKTVVGLTLI